ncbi:hypothetical protein chiPu_0000658 [Chiloscyllium punctatum]|uniref:BTB/POZ domain-containing protein 16 n=1 Tax=Chiloscyllium punctatum TaxID=137246 RepID=A0A401RVW6_CHIPU|nr:hypothetical protein [Chiloscyllium punctatum]
MESGLEDHSEKCSALEQHLSEPHLSYHPRPPPKARNNAIRRSALPEASKPKEFSCCYSRRLRDGMAPDVILDSMNTLWELHSQFLSKSEVLFELLITSEDSSYCMNRFKGAPDNCQGGFAMALGNLYNDEPYVEAEYILGVFAAASVLKFMSLFHKCGETQYNQEKLVLACERWLELNLIVHLRYEITFRYLQKDIFKKTLLSPRLQKMFVYLEKDVRHKYFGLFQAVRLHGITEIYTELLNVQAAAFFSQALCNVDIKLARNETCDSNDLTSEFCSPLCSEAYGLFTTSPDEKVETEKNVKEMIAHAYSYTRQIEELQQIDLLPRDWLLYIVTRSYYALQHGGDVPCLKYLSSEAVRFGFIIAEEPWYHSQIVSYCGFYFELKAIQEKKGSSCSFFMQRISPADPSMPFGITEHKAFSLRHERDVKYEIQVQALVDEEWKVFSTGYICQKFGITKKCSQSQVLSVAGLTMPVYATFALFFPVSFKGTENKLSRSVFGLPWKANYNPQRPLHAATGHQIRFRGDPVVFDPEVDIGNGTVRGARSAGSVAEVGAALLILSPMV